MNERQNRGLDDPLRAKIRAAIKASGHSAAAVSEMIGRNESYVRQFLRGIKTQTIGARELVLLEQKLLLDPGALTHLAPVTIATEEQPSDSADPPDRLELKITIDNEIAKIKLEGEMPAEIALKIRAMVKEANLLRN